MKLIVRIWVLVSLVVAPLGCSSSSGGDGPKTRVVPGSILQAGAGGLGDSAGPAPSATGAIPIAGGQNIGDPATGPAQVMEEEKGECGSVQIVPNIMFTPGNLLVVFDRSISMSTPFDMSNNTNRLDNAKHAISLALSPLVCPEGAVSPDGMACIDTLSVALLTFPTAPVPGGGGFDLSCVVDGLDTPEQINWAGVSDFVRSFEPFWMARTLIDGRPLYPGNYPLVFGTPISVAFARADAALKDPMLDGNKAVLFLTDGEETGECTDGVDPVATATAWNDLGIRTHVVSVASDVGQAFNDSVAAAGGTGQSINPTNSAELTDEITKIVLESRGQVACEIAIADAKLTNVQQACDFGEVFVSATKVPCDQANKAEGFFIKNETTIEIVGSYCSRLEGSMDLRANFPCEILAPL